MVFCWQGAVCYIVILLQGATCYNGILLARSSVLHSYFTARSNVLQWYFAGKEQCVTMVFCWQGATCYNGILLGIQLHCTNRKTHWRDNGINIRPLCQHVADLAQKVSKHPVTNRPLKWDRLAGLVVTASASRAEDPGFESRLRRDFSVVESYQWLKNWHSSGLPCQAPGVIGSALPVVGPVSVYCDWVRWKVWSATSISVWHHVKLSE